MNEIFAFVHIVSRCSCWECEPVNETTCVYKEARKEMGKNRHRSFGPQISFTRSQNRDCPTWTLGCAVNERFCSVHARSLVHTVAA